MATDKIHWARDEMFMGGPPVWTQWEGLSNFLVPSAPKYNDILAMDPLPKIKMADKYVHGWKRKKKKTLLCEKTK